MKNATVPTKIVDKNGKLTTVHKKPHSESGNRLNDFASVIRKTSKATSELPLKEMDGSLLSSAIISATNGSERVSSAITLASYLHRNALRRNRGNLPKDNYITHPLRNSLRLIRRGIYEQDVIIACTLHDTVEDEADQIIELLGNGNEPKDRTVEQKQERALELISDVYGPHVMSLVASVTNKPLPREMPKAQKQQEYAKKVIALLDRGDDEEFVIKWSDFSDNAGSLYLQFDANPDMVISMAKKYLLICDPMIKRIDTCDLFSAQDKKEIKSNMLRIKSQLEGFAALK